EPPPPPPVEAGTDAGIDVTPPPLDAPLGDAGADAGYLFDDEFDKDLSRWTLDDAGAWALAAGELVHGASARAECLVTGFAGATDYRAESRMRVLANAVGGAIEIAFRIDVATGDEWHCNWEPVPDTNGTAYLRLQQHGSATVV